MEQAKPMLFFFNLRRGGEVLEDPEGVACLDVEEARSKAVLAARSMMASEAMSGIVDLDQEITVVTDNEIVASIPFGDAVLFRAHRVDSAPPP